jgi:hypothetical protein
MTPLVSGIRASEISWTLAPGPPPPLDGVRGVLSAALTLLYRRERQLRSLRLVNSQLRDDVRRLRSSQGGAGD